MAAAGEMLDRRTAGDGRGLHRSLKSGAFGIFATHAPTEELKKLLRLWKASPSEDERYLALDCLGRANAEMLVTDVKHQDVSDPKDSIICQITKPGVKH